MDLYEQMFPKEMEEYLQMIKKQRLNFEQTLEECDAILTNSLNGIQGIETIFIFLFVCICVCVYIHMHA